MTPADRNENRVGTRRQFRWCVGALVLAHALSLTAALRAQEIIASVVRPVADGSFGGPIAALGDTNGDGSPDFVTATANASDILPFAVLLEVRSGKTGGVLWAVGRTNALENFGVCAAVDDLDGDGVADLAVGAPGGPPSTTPDPVGYVAVFSGRTGSLLHTMTAVSADDDLGRSVAGISDLDGDGRGDVLSGASNETTVNGLRVGVVHAYSGASGAPLFAISGAVTDARFGESVVAIGDCDGDLLQDFAVSAPDQTIGGVVLAGAVTVFSGSTQQPLWQRVGSGPQKHLGVRIAAAGDVDADGFPDALVREYPTPGVSGAPLFVCSGFDGSILRQLSTDGSPLVEAIAGAGDLDHDGFADFAVSNRDESSQGHRGSVKVFSGASGSTIWVAYGNTTLGVLGRALCSVGDVNGDGIADLGASTEHSGPTSPPAAVRILTGTCGRTEVFGLGCPTSVGGMPTLTPTGSTCLTPLGHGVTLRIDPTIAPSSPPFGLVMLSPQETSIALPGGCTLVADPAQSSLIAVPFLFGGLPYALSLGPVPPAVPLGVYIAQAFRFDSGLPRGYCATNGMRLEVP